MYNLKINYSKKSTLILILISIWTIYPIFANITTINETIEAMSNSQEPEFDQMQIQPQSFLKWKELITNADHNENGINDNFEIRLKELSEVGYIEENGRNSDDKNTIDGFLGIQTRKTEVITVDDIPIIVSFPRKDYDLSLFLFEELGGKVKSTYDAAINGFAGSINYDGLIEFVMMLKQNNMPFLVEEDRIYQAHLYYAGRNMNLRPYVWNTYDGDDYSSIAIIDTGVDDSHNFFSPGYSAGDFNYKIVGWRDEINGLTSPYDDNGHGSHCSGIASGEGSPNYDGSGRTVATAAYPFDYTGYDVTPGMYMFNWTRFNVTDPGSIELFCEFDDSTPGFDDVDFGVYLYYENTIKTSYIGSSDSWSHTLSYTATSSSLGMYSFRFVLDLIDNTADGYVSDFNITFRSEIHWPFDPPRFGSGDPWKGVAPDAHIVGVKVLDQYGSGSTSDIIDGINWVITNKLAYNITTMSLSLGGGPGQTSMINAVNNAVEQGIVTVVSAGNSGPGGNNVGSPGDADNVITVAAMSIDDLITDYSSQGGSSYKGNTVKPDITAPGGSFNNLQMFSTDTNDNDAMPALFPNPAIAYPTDVYANDMEGAQGTSMSAPAVAGASNLLIEAMGGHESWGYTSTEAKRVKALLLMSATETYPLLRETYSTTDSPVLNRGGKDVHEGYGRLNVDVAIEAYTQELTLGSQFNAWITSSLIDPFNKHGLGCYANLISSQNYVFTLDVPSGADFDLYLYSDNPSSIGEPIMVASSTSTGLGTDETISHTATNTGKYYLIAKAISGEGNAIISYPIIDHDLSVSLEVPTNAEIGNSYIINATVKNTGNNPESNVDLFLYLDKVEVNSTNILSLPVDASKTINYTWIPTESKTYNFTAEAPPVPGETILINNKITKLILIRKTIFFEDFESGLSKWETITGLWHLTGDTSIWPDPYHSPTHSMWFGNESTGDYDTGYREMGELISDLIDLTPYEDTILEFYHWREGEIGYDFSFVDISIDGINWDPLYDNDTSYIPPWEKVSLDISGYAGYPSVQLKFSFDTGDAIANDYRGWLVDDIEILGTSIYDHDLSVSLDTPVNPEIGNSYIINATVTNTGLNDEFDVDLLLYLDVGIVNSTTISTLPVGVSETINYSWIPPDLGSYNFTAYAPPVPDETFTTNNIVTKIIHIVDVKLFDGMFIDYTFTFGNVMPAHFTWSQLSEFIFHTDWYMGSDHDYWDVDAQTRVMSNSGGSGWYFGDSYHTPLWIFTEVSIGEQILIAVDAEGDHIFEVSRELTYYLPGFGLVGVWELEDLTYPGGIAWYENSTGILLNGTFYFGSGYNYAFDFLDTNVQFSYIPIDHDLKVSLEVPINPEIGNSYIINATVTNNGLNDEYDVDLLLYLDDGIVNSTTISTLPVGASETINYIWNPPDFGSYNFTAYAPPELDETITQNNIVTEIIHIVETQLFDGMYIAHDFTDLGFGTWPSNILYTYNTGEIFDVAWDFTVDGDNWQVNCMNREITGSSNFADFTHTPMWIFPSVSLGDTVLISSVWEVDHTFEVQDELIYDLPGFGLIEIWVLQDLGDPSATAWYEKSTGILLNGTFYYDGGNNYLIFEFVDTNVEFTYYVPTSITITTPDSTSSWETATSQSITWTSTGSILDVKIELYKNDVFVTEIVASTPNDGEFSWTIPTTLVDSTQYQIKISDVAYPTTDDFSDNFEIFTTPAVIDSITITKPDSLTAWEMGTSQDITWTSTGSIADVKIELYKGGVFEMEIVASTANDGSYNWTIPTDLEDGIDYQIRISDVSNPATSDDSDDFALTSIPIPPGPPPIPGYNLYLILATICILSIILTRRRIKKA